MGFIYTNQYGKTVFVTKKILRSICNVSYDAHTSEIFRNFKIITIYNSYDYRLCASFRKEKIRGSCFLENLACLQENSPAYPTRGAEKWKMVTQRTNYGSQMLQFTLPNLLNTFCSNVSLENLTFKDLRGYFCT